ncbi:hypothetical protein V6N13_042500 [Hibiscus sabdariffa]|uniref:Uncharacterized protein n=1 Tax=Hibiscus sabdariffa TaxID=183260 RepID=A0ABR2G5D3_9ROSI
MEHHNLTGFGVVFNYKHHRSLPAINVKNDFGKGSGRKGCSRKPGRDSAEKKELVTLSSDRPIREREVVERYSAEQQTARTQVKLALMFQIVKASKQADHVAVSTLIHLLRVGTDGTHQWAAEK